MNASCVDDDEPENTDRSVHYRSDYSPTCWDRPTTCPCSTRMYYRGNGTDNRDNNMDF
ncbi:hypothetical protein ASPVEDRAFT_46611 [Aspergillus versicolor CBS 583.65]|uniref:Uncharacterized protein n=1 Tax=Aspergillus versicolor CBS 583.65 TaxID=1036611 RepID=A0A1L9Q0F8_ASPVE|nr:uncharacterized protein ASPVEDRAFT_46611 [Aspergillus versicolor CBS 583.65]OJJ07261.1 hypothetical protein ASPVEDRAFT_46611 [Aspergillus versicolor CBS 583.65]